MYSLDLEQLNSWKFSPSETSRCPSVSGARFYSDVLGQAPISAASLHKLHKRLTRPAERLQQRGEGGEGGGGGGEEGGGGEGGGGGGGEGG